MLRKVLIGMLGFLIVCLLGDAGYRFGQHLAHQDDSADTTPRH